MDHFLDLTGYVCPVPLKRTMERAKALDAGDVLTVQTEHARAVRNIMDWAWREGIEVDVEERDRGVWLIKLQKK